jgi:hypothetical protein
MTIDDLDIREMLVSRAARANPTGLGSGVVSRVPETPQLTPIRRRVSDTPTRRPWLIAAVAAVIAFTVPIAVALLPRAPQTGLGSLPTEGSPSARVSPSVEVPELPDATDVLLTPPPYADGSCPVTPITALAGGYAPVVTVSGIDWRWGGQPWLAKVGQKVVLSWTAQASVIGAERIPIGGPTGRLSTRYPEGGGPGFVFGVGLPERGCWLLTAIGTFSSSVVVSAGPAPANPRPASEQGVPTKTVAQTSLPSCPASPLDPAANFQTWLDGPNRWTDPRTSPPWVAGDKRKLVVSGDIGARAAYQVVVATQVGTVWAGREQAPAFVTNEPVFAPLFGSESKAFDLTLPTAGCWALTYIDPVQTSTIVVDLPH